jgi:hypothetical protein
MDLPRERQVGYYRKPLGERTTMPIEKRRQIADSPSIEYTRIDIPTDSLAPLT